MNRRYSHGTLQKTNVWHQAVQANQPGKDNLKCNTCHVYIFFIVKGADSSSVSRMEPPESDSSSNEIIMSSDED